MGDRHRLCCGRVQCPRRTARCLPHVRPWPHRPDLALAGRECQRAFLALARSSARSFSPIGARKPSTTTSVTRSASVRVVGLHRLAPDHDRLHVAHVDIPAHGARLLRGPQQLAEHAPETRPRRRAPRSSMSIPTPASASTRPRSVAPHCSTIDRRKVNSASPDPRIAAGPGRRSTMPLIRSSIDRPEQVLLGRESAGRRCRRRRRRAGRSRRSAPTSPSAANVS